MSALCQKRTARILTMSASVQRFDFDDGSTVIAANPEAYRRCRVVYKYSANVCWPRQQIINHLAGFCVQPCHLVRDHRSGPCVLVFVESDIIGRCPARGELPLLELLRSGIEHSDAVATVLAKPETILRIHASAPRRGASRWSLEELDRPGLGVDTPDMLVAEIGEIDVVPGVGDDVIDP